MKKLEELGISPAPWKVGGDGYDVANDENEIITDEYDQFSRADARLIAAAPELYEAVWDILFKGTRITNCRNCKGAEFGNCKTCQLGKARAALAEAAGESEVAK